MRGKTRWKEMWRTGFIMIDGRSPMFSVLDCEAKRTTHWSFGLELRSYQEPCRVSPSATCSQILSAGVLPLQAAKLVVLIKSLWSVYIQLPGTRLIVHAEKFRENISPGKPLARNAVQTTTT